MEKYKVCPVCGKHNNPLFLECMDCEADLQSVPVVDDQSLATADAQPAPEVMVRLCDCGEKNPVQARRCRACGEDISIVAPTPDRQLAAVRYVLSSLDGSFAYEIPEGTTVIGREFEMGSYLSGRAYVSRRHALLILDTAAGTLTVQNDNSSNHTFVNNRMLSGDMCAVLQNGDELGLGGNVQNGSRQAQAAYFLVRIGECI